ncbi:MAG: glycerol-3-phosphate 1-O-acyltransferase PlsY [Defluviitaleaceae bacterium]|nr:glycerol-3-phosphate 1-O-acyltransferase PlsY [Defluviitaleaceae bacterium]
MEFVLESGMFRILAVVIGYFLGNIQTSYLFGKLFKNTDIRKHGSGNPGTANTIRTFGLSVGAIVFIVDVLKAVTAFLLCMYLFGGSFFDGYNGLLPGMYAGVGVVLGHNFPFFMRFRGGKGIASSIGVMLCTDWRIVVIQTALGLSCLFTTRMISIVSLALTLVFPVLMLVFRFDIEAVLISVFLTALAWIMHRGNIKRILTGSERKLSFGKSRG